MPRLQQLAYVASSRFPDGMTADDLVAVGLEAAWRVFEKTPGAINKYVDNKVRWVMLDAIRSWTGGSRSGRRSFPVRMERIDDPNARELADPKQIAEEELLSQVQIKLILAAVERLPERERDIVRSRLQGKSLSEIAAVFGVSAPRVSQLLTRAVASLRHLVLR